MKRKYHDPFAPIAWVLVAMTLGLGISAILELRFIRHAGREAQAPLRLDSDHAAGTGGRESGPPPTREPGPKAQARRSPPPSAPGLLFAAIRQVESGGDDHAVGSAGERGPYQIMRAYWRDACEYAGLDWSYEDHVNDRARCERIMELYWQRYGAETDAERAVLHHRGAGSKAFRYLVKIRKAGE